MHRRKASTATDFVATLSIELVGSDETTEVTGAVFSSSLSRIVSKWAPPRNRTRGASSSYTTR